VVRGGVDVSDREGEVGGGGGEDGGLGELALEGGGEGDDVRIPGGDQATPATVEGFLFEDVKRCELGLLDAKDGRESRGDNVAHDGAFVRIAEPLDIPRLETQERTDTLSIEPTGTMEIT
jgi:hypothetical protein